MRRNENLNYTGHEDYIIMKELSIHLRPWKIENAPNLAAAINNKKVPDNLRDGIPFPYTEKDAAEFINATLAAEKDSQYSFAILFDGQVIGSIGVFRKENVHRLTAEMGYYINELYWGKGIMTEAVKQMCAYVFANTDIVRIFAEPYAHNDASCRVLEKAGFSFEGMLRQNAIKNGLSVDMKMYSLLRTDAKLAKALTAETTELIPFLSYLLQDLWELGSNPRDIITLIKRHISLSQDTKFLDLACGKGAVSVNITKELGVTVHGFDLLPDFIGYAKQKAAEWGVADLCRFAVADANEIVNAEKEYDGVIFGAVGDVLGNPKETLQKLYQTIKPGGYIIMDATYLYNDKNVDSLAWEYEYLHRADWFRLFEELKIRLIEELPDEEGHDFEGEMRVITARANELIAKYPEKRALFEGYLKTQQCEVDDLENALSEGTWILQRI